MDFLSKVLHAQFESVKTSIYLSVFFLYYKPFPRVILRYCRIILTAIIFSSVGFDMTYGNLPYLHQIQYLVWCMPNNLIFPLSIFTYLSQSKWLLLWVYFSLLLLWVGCLVRTLESQFLEGGQQYTSFGTHRFHSLFVLFPFPINISFPKYFDFKFSSQEPLQVHNLLLIIYGYDNVINKHNEQGYLAFYWMFDKHGMICLTLSELNSFLLTTWVSLSNQVLGDCLRPYNYFLSLHTFFIVLGDSSQGEIPIYTYSSSPSFKNVFFLYPNYVASIPNLQSKNWFELN